MARTSRFLVLDKRNLEIQGILGWYVVIYIHECEFLFKNNHFSIFGIIIAAKKQD